VTSESLRIDGELMKNGMTNGNGHGRSEPLPLADTFEGFSGDLRRILWRHLWLVLLPVVLALGVGQVYLQRATPQYTSTARIYVEQTGPRMLDRDTGGVITRWDSYLFTQVELLRSTEVLTDVLKAPAMAGLQTFAATGASAGALLDGLETEVGKRDDIINVSFTTPYPDEAATIVNTVVETYITAHNKRRSSLSAEAVKILGDERAKREKELMDKRQKLAEFELQNEDLVFGADRDRNVILRSLEQLRLTLTQAQVAALDSQAFYATCQRMAGDPSKLREYVEAQRGKGGYVAIAGQVEGLQADLKRLERERADCLQRLKADTPAIGALDADIVRVQQQIQLLDKEFATVQLAVAEEQLAAARDRQKALEALFEQQRRDVVVLSSQLAQYNLLQSDYERTKTFCDTLDDRIRVLGVDPQVGGLNLEILESGHVPTAPSRPRVPKTMGLALCLGLFTGVGLALQREWRDQRLRSTEEISDLLGLPVLGVVPTMTSPNQTPAIRGQKVRISPDSREAEAFRSLRTAIFHRVPKGKGRTILVTSAAPGEGKSMVVGNLAITMAHAGQRVVVVDANLRQPGQYVLFSMEPNGKGLSSVVAGKMSLEDALVRTKIDNLSILTSGPVVPNLAEMIDSENFARLLRKLAEGYDRIIIDSPSIIAVTDAQILATLCDVTVLVVRVRAASRKVSMHAQHRLESVDARILGVVVNDVRLRGDDCGYGEYNYREIYNDVRGSEELVRNGA
jgi:succinoglycan biosynthesis transport protein ExoP